MSTPVKFINEPVIEVDEQGNHVPFIPVQITNNRQAYAASLNIIFKHIADFHITILTVVADKYGLNVDEILEEVHKDERYVSMSGVINTLGILDQEDAAAAQELIRQQQRAEKLREDIDKINVIKEKANAMFANAQRALDKVRDSIHYTPMANAQQDMETARDTIIGEPVVPAEPLVVKRKIVRKRKDADDTASQELEKSMSELNINATASSAEVAPKKRTYKKKTATEI